MNDMRIDLQKEIILFREKLDSLLDVKPLNCTEVQEMSVRLDKLITRYYLQNSPSSSLKTVV